MGVGPCEVSDYLVAAYGQFYSYGDVDLLEAVVVSVVFSKLNAVWQLRDGCTHSSVGVVKDTIQIGKIRVDSEFGGKSYDSFASNLGGTEHR